MSQKGVPFLVFLLIVFVSLAWNATAQTPQDLYARGMQAARRGEYPKALQDLHRAVDLHPEFAKAHAGLGTIYLQLGDFDASEAALKRALAITPGLLYAEANLAAVYAKTARYEEATGVYRDLLRRHSESIQVWLGITSAYQQADRFEEAIAAYHESLNRSPNLAAAMANGYQDLFVANGHLHENLAELGQEGTYGQRNLLFRNNSNGTFTEISETLGPGMKLTDVSRGATFADYDLDGDIDIVVTNSNTAPRLLRNDGGNRKNWLQIRLTATNGSTDAIGARVKITTGKLTQTREVRSGDGYLSQQDLTLHFGIGDSEQVHNIEVQWQTGAKQFIGSVPANQVLSLEENGDE